VGQWVINSSNEQNAGNLATTAATCLACVALFCLTQAYTSQCVAHFLIRVQAKDVELSNPSKRSISYSVRLEGSSDFAVDRPVLRVDPQSTARLAVTCYPSCGVPQEARQGPSSPTLRTSHSSSLPQYCCCQHASCLFTAVQQTACVAVEQVP
jgi:hypothetical protein